MNRAYRLCASGELVETGSGIRFNIQLHGNDHPCFLIRYRGKPRAYLNECAHQAVELDWEPGEFFDLERQYLICATHGALYDPATGSCVSGRCGRNGLTPLEVSETDGVVYLKPENGLNFVGIDD